MSEIPEDIKQAAKDALQEWHAEPQGRLLVEVIAKAILAERQRCAELVENHSVSRKGASDTARATKTPNMTSLLFAKLIRGEIRALSNDHGEVVERYLDQLSYDPGTGVFRWLVSRGRMAQAGDIAGAANDDGYILINIGGRKYGAHRIAWRIVHGKWPDFEIDHINRDPSDNRISNLREATRSQNCVNRKVVRKGLKGAYPNGNRWCASIKINGRVRHLGSFATEQEAHSAYANEAKLAHGSFARLE